jgi:hypothetical protein
MCAVDVGAEPFLIGGKTLNIPAPKDFAVVTPEMKAIYSFSRQTGNDFNERLAYYIPENIAAQAKTEMVYEYDRYCLVDVKGTLKNQNVDAEQFSKFKDAVKSDFKKRISDQSRINRIANKMSKGVSKELDAEYRFGISGVLPYEAHYETENVVAISLFKDLEYIVEGMKEAKVESSTLTLLNVDGKVIFLNCSGPRNDMEWTRSASKEWADQIILENSELLSQTQETAMKNIILLSFFLIIVPFVVVRYNKKGKILI